MSFGSTACWHRLPRDSVSTAQPRRCPHFRRRPKVQVVTSASDRPLLTGGSMTPPWGQSVHWGSSQNSENHFTPSITDVSYKDITQDPCPLVINSVPSSLSPQRSGTQISNPPVSGLVPLPRDQPPPWVGSAHLISITRRSEPSALANAQGFPSSAPGEAAKTKYMFLIINHDITILH